MHLLAHHPDFEGVDTSDVEVLKSIAKYLEDYFEVFVTSENLSFFFQLALSIKTVRDKQSPDDSDVRLPLRSLAPALSTPGADARSIAASPEPLHPCLLYTSPSPRDS